MRRLSDGDALDDAAMTRALEQLREVVRARGLKASAVRDAVAVAALQRRGHFVVEELVHELKERRVVEAHPATVYRVLPLLVEAGLLQATMVSSGSGACYERAFEREHHDHLICTTCGTVVEFHFEAIEVLQHDVAERFGFRLSGHVHELLGTCAECSGGPQERGPTAVRAAGKPRGPRS